MENEARRRELEKLEEDDEEEETTLIHVRKPKPEKNDSKVNGTCTVFPRMNDELISESEGQGTQSTLSTNRAHREESTLVNGEKKEKSDEVLENEAENLVFFDKVEGVGHGKMEILSQSYKASEEIESADIGLLNEETEYDVETVLQKQNTHDLYCPNCNSCITRRVILRKRKHTRTLNSYEVVKRKKTANPPVQASDDQDHPHHIIGAEEYVDRDSGPDLFRCLSCFSFFIPTGNGFRLFWKFGDKSRKENVRDEQVPRRKKNWPFTSLFASHNQDTVIEQGTAENDDTFECEDTTLLSPRHEHPTNGIVAIYDSGNETPKITEKIDAKMEHHVVAGYHLKEPIISNDKFEVVSGYHLKEPVRRKEQVEVFIDNHLKEPIRSKEQVEAIAGYHLKEPIGGDEEVEVIAGYHLKEPIRGDEEVEVITGYHLKEPVISKDVQVTFGSDLLVTTPVNQTEIVNEEPALDAIYVSRKGGSNVVIFSNDGSTIIEKSEEGQILIQTAQKGSMGKDTVLTIDPHSASEIVQGIVIPAETAIPTQTTTRTSISVQEPTEEVRRNSKIEVVKSIVYGGLAESITSLSVVSSAAGGDVATLNVLALGMANLIGGFFVICHNLWELKCEQTDQVTNQKDRYQELLGQRRNFKLHAIVCVLSYLVFGLTPIIVYGFSFRRSEDRELKLVVVGAVSLLCIIALSIGKASVCRPPKAYVKTVIKFVVLGFMASGISYAAGVLVKRFLEKLGLFQPTSVSGMIFNRVASEDSIWASY